MNSPVFEAGGYLEGVPIEAAVPVDGDLNQIGETSSISEQWRGTKLFRFQVAPPYS